MKWIIPVAALALIGYYLDREIWFHEGARLGPRIQGWLYNRWARQYDHHKSESQQNDSAMLARPLIELMAAQSMRDVLMLDVATGTGRVPLTLLSQPDFDGRIIALDLSEEMLNLAGAKLTGSFDRVELLHHTADHLPFDDDTFDVVSCVEALIIMPNLERPLAELVRVLRPGGIFLSTHSLEVYPAKRGKLSQPEYEAILRAAGFTDIQFESWWRKFERVIARKAGNYSAGPSARMLVDVLHCPNCDHIALDASYHCTHCGQQLTKHNHVLMT